MSFPQDLASTVSDTVNVKLARYLARKTAGMRKETNNSIVDCDPLR